MSDNSITDAELDALIKGIDVSSAYNNGAVPECKKCGSGTKRAVLRPEGNFKLSIVDSYGQTIYNGKVAKFTVVCLRCGSSYEYI